MSVVHLDLRMRLRHDPGATIPVACGVLHGRRVQAEWLAQVTCQRCMRSNAYLGARADATHAAERAASLAQSRAVADEFLARQAVERVAAAIVTWAALSIARVLIAEERDDDGCECEEGLVPGALYRPEDGGGVQRCDLCQRFEGDLDAALALAQHLGGTVRWIAESDPNDAEPRTYTGPQDAAEGLLIAEGTDPWVEVDGAPVEGR